MGTKVAELEISRGRGLGSRSEGLLRAGNETVLQFSSVGTSCVCIGSRRQEAKGGRGDGQEGGEGGEAPEGKAWVQWPGLGTGVRGNGVKA